MARSRGLAITIILAAFVLLGGAAAKHELERCPAGEPAPDYFRVEAMSELIDGASSKTLVRLDPEAVRAQRTSRGQLESYVRGNPDCCIYGGKDTGELTPVSFFDRVQGRGKHVVSIKLEPRREAPAYAHVRFDRCGKVYRGD